MPIAIDSETWPITYDDPCPRVVSLSIASESGASVIGAHDPAATRVIREALAAGAILANAPFDMHVWLKRWPELLPDVVEAYQAGRVYDVITREKLIDIADGMRMRRGGYGLGAVAYRRAGVELNKDDPWRTRYGELDGVDVARWPAEAHSYALADACATFSTYVHQEQERARRRHDIFGCAWLASIAHLALYAQTIRGIDTDAAAVEALDAKIGAEIVQLAGELLSAGLVRAERGRFVKNTKAAMAMLQNVARERGGKVRKTSKGVSLDKSAQKDARVPPGHALEKYTRYGSLITLRSKQIPPLRSPIVRTRYDEMIETGRTSSSAPEQECWPGTNMQNLPTGRKTVGGFRECLVPPSGHVFLASDWSTIELGTLAQVQVDWFRRSKLADAINEGRDVHAEMGSAIIGIDPATFDKTIDAHKDARSLAKPVNFGLPGGMGVARFVSWALAEYGIEISEQRGRQLKRLWQRQWPEMRPYHDRIKYLHKVGDGVMILPRVGLVRGGCSYTDACNFPFQGLAAAIAKTALWWLWLATKDPASPLFGCWYCLFVHDENVGVAPKDRADEALAEQHRIMIAAARHWCPDVAIGCESKILARYEKD